jgi:RNA polymerase sigma-70 factor (ECF subfamily)
MNSPSLPEMYGECIRAAGKHRACDDFFRIILPVLKRISSRVAHQFDAPGEVDDLVQEVSLKLLASGVSILQSLPQDPGATLAYFSVLAANSARDFFRTRRACKRGTQATFSIETQLATVAASLNVAHDYDRDLLVKEIEENLPEDRREQVVFRLYYRQGLTAKEISDIPALKLSVKGVESMILRITRSIRARFQGVKESGLGEGISSSAT